MLTRVWESWASPRSTRGGGSSKRLTEESRPAIMDDELSRQKAEGDIP